MTDKVEVFDGELLDGSPIHVWIEGEWAKVCIEGEVSTYPKDLLTDLGQIFMMAGFKQAALEDGNLEDLAAVDKDIHEREDFMRELDEGCDHEHGPKEK